MSSLANILSMITAFLRIHNMTVPLIVGGGFLLAVHRVCVCFYSVQKGDVVMVKRMSVGEGWWEGELNGRRGLFPSSFVKLVCPRSEDVPVELKCLFCRGNCIMGC